jgi:hypothetical protein
LATKFKKNEKQQGEKKMLNYRPNGGRQLGIPCKRIADEAKTGLSKPELRRIKIKTAELSRHEIEMENI